MVTRFAFVAAVSVAVAIGGGCTFYTACPTDNGNGNAPATAGTNNGTAGTSSGGGGGGDGGNDPGSAGSINPGPEPTGEFVNVTANLAELADGGGDLTLVSPVPGTSRIIAGVFKAGLWASDDGGKSWSALGTGENSEPIDNGPMALIYDPDHTERFWEVGIYGRGVFRTDDEGKTFKSLGTLGHCDLLSVDFTDPDRQTLLAGPHEKADSVSLSKDGGENWEDIGKNLPSGYNFSTLPLIIDTQTFLLGSCGFGGGKCGVFRSEDGGDNWEVVSKIGPAGRPLRTTDGHIFWALYDGSGLLVSDDLGQTWTTTSPGPIHGASLVELPNGKILALGEDYPLVTDDHGDTWTRVGGKLPFRGGNCGTYGLTYSPERREIFINHNDCTGVLTDDAVWSVPFDYETESE